MSSSRLKDMIKEGFVLIRALNGNGKMNNQANALTYRD